LGTHRLQEIGSFVDVVRHHSADAGEPLGRGRNR
jgi:hypothetical protein